MVIINILGSGLIVLIVGLVALHVESRWADPTYSPGDPLPWDKLKQKWRGDKERKTK